MLSRQFLSWAERAPAGERAEAAGNLARACLYAELDAIERGEMERAMTCLLDDPSPLVRRALAEALAGAADAPHHLVAALANDQADIAALVLARSPRLTDAELDRRRGARRRRGAMRHRGPARPVRRRGGRAGRGRLPRRRAGPVPQQRRRAGRRLGAPHPGALRPRGVGGGEVREALGARPDLGAGAAPRARRRHRGRPARLRDRLRLDGARARPPRRRRGGRHGPPWASRGGKPRATSAGCASRARCAAPAA